MENSKEIGEVGRNTSIVGSLKTYSGDSQKISCSSARLKTEKVGSGWIRPEETMRRRIQ
jgi:hypothetical protein